jgi:cellulose synthase/poly-beta-1,6-N-acetylglucosamine synthase-like glycosyltransferase
VELLHRPERQGKMAAINRALPHCRGEIIVFSDTNNRYDADTLRALVAPFADPAVGLVSGAKSIRQSGRSLDAAEGLYWRYESRIKTLETQLGSTVSAVGEVLALRKTLYTPPPDDVINDDFYLLLETIRQGYRAVYAPRARSTEYASASAGDEITRRTRIVAGRWQAIFMAPRMLSWRRPVVAWQIVSHKFSRPLVPLGMLAALLANLAAVIWPPAGGQLGLLWLAPPFNWILLIGQIAFYALALIGIAFKPGGRIGKVLYLPTFLLNSNLAAVIGAYHYATRRSTVLWERVARHQEDGKKPA